MLKKVTGLWMALCVMTVSVAFADTGSASDTGGTEEADTGHTSEAADTGTGSDTAATSTSSSNTKYSAAQLADDSGGCTTAHAVPAMWMFGCASLLVFRRRIR